MATLLGMKFLISRGNYARVTAGMTDAERAQVDAMFEQYPADLYEDAPVIQVDQSRVGQRFVELQEQARQRDAAALLAFAAAQALPPPWKEYGPGVWTAPPGTPAPFVSGEPPTVEEFNTWTAAMPVPDLDQWIPVEDLVGEMYATEDRELDRWRLLLNNLVEGVPAGAGIVTSVPPPGLSASASPLEDVLTWMQRIKEMGLPKARRLEGGDIALAAIAAVLPPSRPKGPAWASGAIGALTGIPIVANADLGPHDWRLVDVESGEVVDEGTIAPELADTVKTARAVLEATAKQAPHYFT